MPKQKDKESEIKELGALIKEAGAKAKALKKTAMNKHFEQIKTIATKSK